MLPPRIIDIYGTFRLRQQLLYHEHFIIIFIDYDMDHNQKYTN